MEETLKKLCPFCGEKHEWEQSTDIHFGLCYIIVCDKKIIFPSMQRKRKI